MSLYRAIAPGYVLDPLGRLVIDPDQRVRDAIALVFRKFREIGSARQTVNWFHQHGVELPVNKSRNGKLEIVFKVPACSMIGEILKNPIYAGAYVYGRRPTEVTYVDGALKRRQDIEMIRSMAVRYGDDIIAAVLNRSGRRTGKGKRWTRERVTSARKQHGISGQHKAMPDPEILTLVGAARHCHVSNTTIARLIKAGTLPSHQIAPFAPQEIRRNDLELVPVKTALGRLRATGRLSLSGGVSSEQGSLFAVNPGKEKGQAS